MKKVLIVTPGKFPVPASQGGAVENLIQILLDNNEKEYTYDFTVITIYDNKSKELSKKYKNSKFLFVNTNDKLYKIGQVVRYIINRIPGVYIGNEYITRVKKIVDFSKYDSVLVENSPEYGLLISHHNIILHMHNDFLNKDTNMGSKIINRYNKVLSLSKYIGNRLQEVDSDYKNIEILYNGVDCNKFVPLKVENYKSKYNIKKDDFVYIFTGRIVKEKGVKELIIAFNSLKDDQTKLLIVGDINIQKPSNKYHNDIINLAKNNKKIIFTGKIPYDELQYYYNIASVGIIPSIWEEPFALTVIENLAVGNPVIITKSGGMVELTNASNSIIVDKEVEFESKFVIAMSDIKKNYNKFNKKEIVKYAKKFSSENYWSTFNELMKK